MKPFNTIASGIYASTFIFVTGYIFVAVNASPAVAIIVYGVGAAILAIPVGLELFNTVSRILT